MLIIFKQKKLSLGVLLRICLIFCKFRCGVAYKNAVYIPQLVCAF